MTANPDFNKPLDVQDQNLAPIMTFKDWIIVFLLSIIPFAGIILMFMWAFGSNVNPNKQNYAKASLLFSAIVLVLYFGFVILMFTVFGMNNLE